MSTKGWKRITTTANEGELSQQRPKDTDLQQSMSSIKPPTTDRDMSSSKLGTGTACGKPSIPTNVKFMTGVPWELDELPRQLRPKSDSSENIFGIPPIIRKNHAYKSRDERGASESRIGLRSNSPSTRNTTHYESEVRRNSFCELRDTAGISTTLPRSSSKSRDKVRRDDERKSRERAISRSPEREVERETHRRRSNTLAKVLSTLRK